MQQPLVAIILLPLVVLGRLIPLQHLLPQSGCPDLSLFSPPLHADCLLPSTNAYSRDCSYLQYVSWDETPTSCSLSYDAYSTDPAAYRISTFELDTAEDSSFSTSIPVPQSSALVFVPLHTETLYLNPGQRVNAVRLELVSSVTTDLEWLGVTNATLDCTFDAPNSDASFAWAPIFMAVVLLLLLGTSIYLLVKLRRENQRFVATDSQTSTKLLCDIDEEKSISQ